MRKLGFLLLIAGILFTAYSLKNDGNITDIFFNPSSGEQAPTERIGQTTEGKETIEAKIINVIDGDTFAATVNGKEERIRLLLVDTPETKHPDKPIQPFGEEASAFTKSILTNGKVVQLEFDLAQRDKYGRLLAYVYVDGKMLNEILLEKGFARLAVFPPNTQYVDEFGALQENAQTAGVGIWSVENYVREDKK